MKADKNVFPYALRKGYSSFTVYPGLTARDYIAIQVMTGLSANSALNSCNYAELADIAYKQADAMLKRSEVKDE